MPCRQNWNSRSRDGPAVVKRIHPICSPQIGKQRQRNLRNAVETRLVPLADSDTVPNPRVLLTFNRRIYSKQLESSP